MYVTLTNRVIQFAYGRQPRLLPYNPQEVLWDLIDQWLVEAAYIRFLDFHLKNLDFWEDYSQPIQGASIQTLLFSIDLCNVGFHRAFLHILTFDLLVSQHLLYTIPYSIPNLCSLNILPLLFYLFFFHILHPDLRFPFSPLPSVSTPPLLQTHFPFPSWK